MSYFQSNDTDEERIAKLRALSKAHLVAMVKAIKGSAGDYDRTPKEDYVLALNASAGNALLSDTMANLGIDPSTMTVSSTAARPTATAAAPDVARISRLLAELLATPTLDEGAVRAIVQEEIADFKPREIIEVIVTVDSNNTEIARIDGAHKQLRKVLALAKNGDNIMLKGPAGTGKTHLACQVAQALGRPFHFNSLTSGASESDVIGKLLPLGEHGRFEFVPGPFLQAFENGGVWLGDEADASDENMFLVLNAGLANGFLPVPARRENPIAKRHPDFVCIIATNTWGHGADSMYVGRNQLDAATLDRFVSGIVTMDYDTDLEAQLCDPAVLSWGHSIREQIKAKKLRRVMSTRALLNFTKQTRNMGFQRAEWEESYFASWTAEERAKITG